MGNYHQLENGWKNRINNWNLYGICKLHFNNISKFIKISANKNNCLKMKSNKFTVHNIIINEVLFMNFQSRVETWLGIIVMLVVYNLRKNIETIPKNFVTCLRKHQNKRIVTH